METENLNFTEILRKILLEFIFVFYNSSVKKFIWRINMNIFSIFTLLGGLATFLFGMNVMGDGLEKRSGDKLKSILEHLTSSPLKGLILGAAVTAVIQSSSATTVMVVGFVNSGIMKLSQSIGVIMGANIGTTMTAWLISLSGIEGDSFILQLLKPSSFAPVLAFIGMIFIMFSKKDNTKHTGYVFVGFGVLMTGMELMSGAVKPLANNPDFTRILLLFNNPLLGILTGALLTAIIQSSSASVGILQALSVTGGITYANAVPIILGQNIGTTVTAILSSIGTNKNARRTAVIHLCFNIIGAVAFLLLFYGVNLIIGLPFINNSINAAGIAVVHTIFNVTSTVVLFPFTNALEKLAYFFIKEDENKNTEEKTALLDERFLATPSIAIARAKDVTNHMAIVSKESLLLAMEQIKEYNKEQADMIRDNEKLVDVYEDKLGTYLVKLSRESLSLEDSHEVSNLLHTIGDFERMSDHAVNLVEVAEEIHTKQVVFSENANQEIRVITSAVTEILSLTTDAFINGDLEIAKQVEPLEQLIDRLRTKMKARHVQRVRQNECSIETGFIFSDLLTNYERVADHCSNVAVCLIEIAHDSFETHEYLSHVKADGENDFAKHYEAYKQKYVI